MNSFEHASPAKTGSNGRRRWLVYVAVFGLVWIGAYVVALAPLAEDSASLDGEIETLKAQYVAKKKQAIELEPLRAKGAEIEQRFGQHLTALPSRIDSQFVDVVQSARARGVRLDQLVVDHDEVKREVHAEQSGRLKVQGSFQRLGGFISDVAGTANLVALFGLKLEATNTPGMLTLEATIRAYRHLDADELAAAAKAKAKEAKKR